MYTERIPTSEAISLIETAIFEECMYDSPWTREVRFIVPWERSHTGYAAVNLTIPNEIEKISIYDVNYEKTVELKAVTPVEITITKWVED